MSNFTKIILLPILAITVLCIGSVEGFYYWVEHTLKVIDEPRSAKIEEKAKKNAPAAVLNQDSNKEVAVSEDYSIITERNLFFSSGAALEILQETDSLAGMELSSLEVVLMGTALGVDEIAKAIIYDKSERKQELYQVGDYIQQAVIKKILRGKVILNYNGKDEILDISDARNVSVPKIAKAKPVVLQRKVAGRPVGQPFVSAGAQPLGGALTDGSEDTKTLNSQGQQPLRSFRGGVTVKGGSTTE